MSVTAYTMLVLIGVLCIYAVLTYNRLVALRNHVQKAWSNIEIVLKQRHDELPKLVAVCREYMRFEQETLERVIAARSRVAEARERRDVDALGAAEGALRTGLGQLFALVESYPTLKAKRQLPACCGAHHRPRGHDRGPPRAANTNNIALELFPDVFIARIFAFTAFKLLCFDRAETEDVDMRALMLGELRLEVLHRLISAGHFLLFGVAYAVKQPLYRTGALVLVGVCSLVAWLAALRRYRLVADTPTSLIASAAQGYVELVGRCELHPGSPALGYLSGPPCVWYRCVVSRRTREGWSSTSRERSSDTFLLRDASGTCVVDPDHAEVTGARKRSWTQGEYRYDLDYLALGDPLYALGELATVGGTRGPFDRRAEVGALLSEWKCDPTNLRERFDADRDGEVNLAEWAKAREAAQREVDRRHLETGPPAALHLLRAPADGRPYLVSNRDPLALARSSRFWAWLHVIVLAVAVVAVFVLLRLAGAPGH